MSKALNLYESIYNARTRGASDDQIMFEIRKQNPDKEPSFTEAINRGAPATRVLEEITKQNKPGFLERVKLSFGGESAQQKRIAIDAIESGASKGDIADVVGDIPATAGMIAGGAVGAAVGAPTGPGAVASAAAGAAGGAAAGELVRQGIGDLLGVRTEEEGLTDITDIGKEAAIGATAEFGGKLLGKTLSFASSKLAPILERTTAMPEGGLTVFEKNLFKTGDSAIAANTAQAKTIVNQIGKMNKALSEIPENTSKLLDDILADKAKRDLIIKEYSKEMDILGSLDKNVFKVGKDVVADSIRSTIKDFSLLKSGKIFEKQNLGRLIPYAADFALPGFGIQAAAWKGMSAALTNPDVAVKVIQNLSRTASWSRPLVLQLNRQNIPRSIYRLLILSIFREAVQPNE